MALKFARIVLPILAAALVAGHAVGEEDPIWTEKPTRVDPSKQHYERLPAVKVIRDSRVWVVVPERIKVLDSTSFSVGSAIYQIADLRPVKSKRICKAIEGGRWPCGRMAAIFLGNLVRGKRLLCDVEQGGKTLRISHCVIGGRNVAGAIVTNGYASAEKDQALLAIQAEAQKARGKGLWRNPECTAHFDTC